jgi:hypothetical protein
MATHRINRAEIEIQAGDVAVAERLIERVSLLRERRIAPLLDRVCSELSGPERVDRVDRLEVDLGALAPDDFDDDFVRKLEAALRAALSKRLAEQRSAGPAQRPGQTSLALLDTFARTGNVPWWADRSEVGLVSGHVRALLADDPRALLRLVRELAGDALALERIARHCDDALLEAIAERTHAGIGGALLAGVRALERVLADDAGSRHAGVVRARGAVLAALARSESREPERILGAALHELVSSWPQALARLASGDARIAAPGWLRSALREADVQGASATETARAGRETAPGTAHLLDDVTSADRAPLPALAAAGEGVLEREQPSALALPPALERTPGDEPPASGPGAGASARLADDDATVPAATAPAAPALAVTAPAAPAPALAPLEPSSYDRPPDPRAIAAARRRALDQLEQLYVDDAGLVILWPFLDRLFQRAGLLDERRQFVDEHAPMQAIALLSQLAFEDPEPPEFRLPLAKLLCGLPPEAGFLLERPPAPEHLDECERLLAAVIGHASILHDMPVASFRATFLQRAGALSVRDGAWLLQVERHAHDLVLERFPWSWSWVKLPWMPDPLRVEW